MQQIYKYDTFTNTNTKEIRIITLKWLTRLYYSQPALHINNWLYQVARKSESLSVRMKTSLTEGNVFLSTWCWCPVNLHGKPVKTFLVELFSWSLLWYSQAKIMSLHNVKFAKWTKRSEIVPFSLVLVLPFKLQKVTNVLHHSMASSLYREGNFVARVD